MKYITPESEMILISNVVATSQEDIPGTSNGYGGGIQLPFIPG